MHLNAERIQAFLDGALGTEERGEVERHAASCAGCQADLDGWRLLYSQLGGLPRAEALGGVRAPCAGRHRELDGFAASGIPEARAGQDAEIRLVRPSWGDKAETHRVRTAAGLRRRRPHGAPDGSSRGPPRLLSGVQDGRGSLEGADPPDRGPAPTGSIGRVRRAGHGRDPDPPPGVWARSRQESRGGARPGRRIPSPPGGRRPGPPFPASRSRPSRSRRFSATRSSRTLP